MLRSFVLAVLLFYALPAFAADNDPQVVVRVINGKSFVLASNDVVRLAAIEVPNAEEKADGVYPARAGEPLGEEARAALTQMLQGHTVRIVSNAAPRDRHNRILGQVYDDKGNWMQGAMIARGLAMVYSFPDDSHDTIIKMLTLERKARAEKRGIWANPYFRVITPAEAGEFVGRFRLVEGKVTSVHDWHGNTYINFSEHWKGNFAVFISHKRADAFAAGNLASLAGKTIRVRGWINYHNAPMIDLTHPEQIEME